MSSEVRNVTKQHQIAQVAAEKFNPGKQPDIAELMRTSYTLGYAQALIDNEDLINLIEAEMQGIRDNALKLASKIPMPVRYLGENVEKLPLVYINRHLNEIRRLLYKAGLLNINGK